MAIIIIKKATTKTHLISIEQDGKILSVSACPFVGDSRINCGYPDSKTIYHYTEYDKAVRTFRRYINKYREV